MNLLSLKNADTSRTAVDSIYSNLEKTREKNLDCSMNDGVRDTQEITTKLQSSLVYEESEIQEYIGLAQQCL